VALEQGFQLRIAFEAHGHVAQLLPRVPVAGIVARRILAFARLAEVPKARHEAVGAPVRIFGRIDAQFRFELEGADCASGIAGACFKGEAVVLAVGGFRILPAVGSDVIECAPCCAKLAALFVRRRRALSLDFKDRIGRAGMPDERPRAGPAKL
jgi:hypothetical protein